MYIHISMYIHIYKKMSLWFIMSKKRHIICAVRLDFEVWTKLSHSFNFKRERNHFKRKHWKNHSFLSCFDCALQHIFRSGAKVFLAAPLRLESRDQDDNIIQYQPSSHLLPYTVQKQSKLDCHIVHYFSMISPARFFLFESFTSLIIARHSKVTFELWGLIEDTALRWFVPTSALIAYDCIVHLWSPRMWLWLLLTSAH